MKTLHCLLVLFRNIVASNDTIADLEFRKSDVIMGQR